MILLRVLRFVLPLLFSSYVFAQAKAHLDVIIEGGTVYDGTNGPALQQDIGIRDDLIVLHEDLSDLEAGLRIDASGLAVAPGFINSLSWATDSLILDGRGQSDIRQGVTTEVFGEGMSMGPLTPALRKALIARQGDIKYDVPWTTLGEYMVHLESSGISPNIASFVGATTVRSHVLGFEDRAPTDSELAHMQKLVAEAMREGALGVGSSLIYAPASFASTAELTALVSTAASFGGMYISHMRSEGDRLLESVDELINIARSTGAAAEIYHLKVSGQQNWPKIGALIERIESAREQGLDISANMYTYTAGSTGLDAAMPTWVQEGGTDQWIARLKDPDIRAQVIAEMVSQKVNWENLLAQAGGDGTLLVGFKNPDLRQYIGKTLAEVALLREQSPQEAAIDLVIEDGSRVQVVYFLMSEKNVETTISLPWVTFGSDAGAYTAAGHFLAQGTHPRAYGNFARVLGKYSRDRELFSLSEAVHRLAYLPAKRFKLKNRGEIRHGNFADIVVFDPDKIRDHATFEDPHQYATGVMHVFVNGVQVLRNGEHTDALPGRFVRGPGWQDKAKLQPDD